MSKHLKSDSLRVILNLHLDNRFDLLTPVPDHDLRFVSPVPGQSRYSASSGPTHFDSHSVQVRAGARSRGRSVWDRIGTGLADVNLLWRDPQGPTSNLNHLGV